MDWRRAVDCCQLLVERKGLVTEKQEQNINYKLKHFKYGSTFHIPKKRDSKLIHCDNNWKLRGFQHPVTTVIHFYDSMSLDIKVPISTNCQTVYIAKIQSLFLMSSQYSSSLLTHKFWVLIQQWLLFLLIVINFSKEVDPPPSSKWNFFFVIFKSNSCLDTFITCIHIK